MERPSQTYGDEESKDGAPVCEGSVDDLVGGPIFLALYPYFLKYGGVFKLAFGPKVFMVLSDPVIVRRVHIIHSGSHTTASARRPPILKDFCRPAFVSVRARLAGFNLRPRRLSTPLLTPFNSTPTSLRVDGIGIESRIALVVVVREVLKEKPFAFSKGVLAEILEPIMGQGLIPAPYAVWKNRRRQLVPGFHKAWLDHMVGLFGDCSAQLVKNLGASHLTLTGPHTTPFAWCTPILKDFLSLRAFLSVHHPSLSIPPRRDAFQLHP